MDKKAGGNSKLQDYEILTKLGQGSFGIVYKVKRKNDQKVYVLKQIDISRMSTAQRKEAVHEATILSKINSPYIVKFYDSFTDRSNINIIMEFCENGDLGIFLKRQMGKQLSESKIWKFFIEMCLGMHYLHANKILHRDIKTINMFLTKEDKIKIGDLGVAKLLNQTANFAHTVVGTPYYLSPELCEEKPYNHKSDVWSLGCVLYELCTLKHPFEANNQGALILKIVRGKYAPISQQYSKDLSNMVDFLLSKDYKKRPSIQEILNTPIMQEKSNYFGYGVAKPDQLLVLPSGNNNNRQQSQPSQQNNEQKQQQQQQRQQNNGSAMPQEQIKKINDAAAALRQNNLKNGNNNNNKDQLILNREKQYQQNLIEAAKQRVAERQQKQQEVQMQVNGSKPAAIQKNNNGIPSSYVDPSKRQGNLLNNNNFDQKEHEKKQQSNIQLLKQQQRPSSNYQQPKPNVKDLQKNDKEKPPQFIHNQQPIISAQNLNQQYVQQQQQLKGIPQNQRVKSGAPQQLSRQAQMAQRQGQRIIKQGDNEKPQIFKPDVKALRPQQSDQQLISKQQQQNPLISQNNPQKPTSYSGKTYQHEINEVMNLPDDIGNKKNQGHQPKSNQDLIAEAQRKRDALNRVNNKFQQAPTQQNYKNLGGADLSGKAASELHDMKLVIPQSQDSSRKQGNSSSRDPSTMQQTEQDYSEDNSYANSNIYGQKLLDDDEFAELLNGGPPGDSHFIQPQWNIHSSSSAGTSGGMRDTQFVPFVEDSKDDDEDDDEVFKVHSHDNNKHHKRGNNKMNTIREDQDEDRKSNGSDTAYFSPDHDINDRDDYDSDEDEVYRERMRQLGALDGSADNSDEDNQPYDLEDQQRKEKEEFGDSDQNSDSEDSQNDDQVAQMSLTMQDRHRMEIEKQIKDCQKRRQELVGKIEMKVKEGTDVTKSVQLFNQCFQLFCDKAQISEELSEIDYQEISAYFIQHVGQSGSMYLTAIVFQLYYFKEELQSISQQLKELQSEHEKLLN